MTASSPIVASFTMPEACPSRGTAMPNMNTSSSHGDRPCHDDRDARGELDRDTDPEALQRLHGGAPCAARVAEAKEFRDVGRDGSSDQRPDDGDHEEPDGRSEGD